MREGGEEPLDVEKDAFEGGSEDLERGAAKEIPVDMRGSKPLRNGHWNTDAQRW